MPVAPRYGARMLWMIIILLIGALSFVMFHKPHVKAMGAGWVPPEQRKPLTPAQPPQAGASLAEGTDAEGQALPPAAPEMPDTFDFNDLFGGKKPQGPTDRPNR